MTVSVCHNNFASINATINTFNDLDAMFEVIMQIISKKNASISTNVLKSPNSIISEAILDINCDNSMDIFQIIFNTNFVIKSTIENELILDGILFQDASIFRNLTRVVLSSYFNTTIAINILNEQYHKTRKNKVSGALIAIVVGLVIIIVTVLVYVAYRAWERHKERERITIYI